MNDYSDCFRKAQEFSPRAALLRHDDSVRGLIHETTNESDEETSLKDRLKKHLWPDMPLVFRPAVTLLIIALLIYPSWLGLRSVLRPEIKPIASVHLESSRGIDEQEFRLDEDLTLTFFHSDQHAGMPYEIKILDDKGRVAVRHMALSRLDEHGTGMLLLKFI